MSLCVHAHDHRLQRVEDVSVVEIVVDHFLQHLHDAHTHEVVDLLLVAAGHAVQIHPTGLALDLVGDGRTEESRHLLHAFAVDHCLDLLASETRRYLLLGARHDIAEDPAGLLLHLSVGRLQQRAQSLHHAAVQHVLVTPPSLAYVRAVETLRVAAVQRHHAADDVERGGDDGGVLVGEEREDGGEHAGGNQILCVRERTDRPSRARAL